MKKRNIFFTLAAVVLLTGCSSDDIEQGGGTVNVPVSLMTSGFSEYKSTGDPVVASGESRRAATGLYTPATGFDGGEQVLVGMNHPAASPQTAIFDVAAPTGTDKKSVLTLVTPGQEPIYYPGTATGSVKVYAMYPSTSQTSHTVKYDQSSTSASGNANYKASDLMFGVTDVAWTSLEQKATLNPNVEFQHQLVKLTLTVVKKVGVKQLQEIRLNNVKRKVPVNSFTYSGLTLGTPASATGETAAQGDNRDEIIITGEQTAADGEVTYTFSCVFPAQAWNDGSDHAVDFLTVKADNYTHTYQLLRNSWTQGTEYQLTLNLHPVYANTTVSITDWTSDTSYATDMVKAATVTTAPTAKTGLVAGTENELVNAGVADGGTMMYNLKTSQSAPATTATGWTPSIPRTSVAGTYYVYYYAKGYGENKDSSVQGPVKVIVN